MQCTLYTNPMSVALKNNELGSKLCFWTGNFNIVFLYSAVNFDWKSECYVIQMLPINVYCYLLCLKISHRL